VNNGDLETTWAYHDGTKHSYSSIRSNPHYLDWANRPLPFKVYPALEPIPLPHTFSPLAVAAQEAVGSTGVPQQGDCLPDLETLARLLYFSAGITKRLNTPGGGMFFRAASCTGALYHIDLYVVCGQLPGLEAGVYHFGVHDFALRRLRQGDFRGVVVEAASGEPAVAAAPAIIAGTSTYWRNSWKYQARTYRHCFWDSGTILANLLAMAAAGQVPARVVAGFVDDSMNRLLDLDTEREVTLTLVPLGYSPGSPSGPAPAVDPLGLETVPLSQAMIDYPEIRAIHAASSLARAEEVIAWRGSIPARISPEPSRSLFPLQPLSEEEEEEGPRDTIEQVILRRGSTRRFAREAITFAQLSAMLRVATKGIPADFLDPPGAAINQPYLIVHAVDGLPSGAYVYHGERETLELLEEGDFRAEAGYLALEQDLAADASVAVFFLADLRPVLERYGNRGYRASQLEASIMGGKLYLAAYAQRIGASGLTFYDDDVTDFFSPHAEGKSVMFLVALGKPAKRRR